MPNRIELADSTGAAITSSNPLSVNVGAGAEYNATPPTVADGDTTPLQTDSAGKLLVNDSTLQTFFTNLSLANQGTTVSVDVTRPNDTNAYTANDAWADSTSAPAALTFTAMAAASGGDGLITDAVFITSGDLATLLQGELWLFDTAPTAVNDNAAMNPSDANMKTFIGKIPFAMEDTGVNGMCHVTGLAIGFNCVGSANLHGLIRVKNAYTPVAQEVLTMRLKVKY